MQASVVFGFIGGVGPTEMLVIMVVAVLLFGKRLPDVGRSLGKSMMEFKKGVRGIEEEFHSVVRGIDDAAATERTSPEPPDDREEATAPKFEPPPAESKAEMLEASRPDAME